MSTSVDAGTLSTIVACGGERVKSQYYWTLGALLGIVLTTTKYQQHQQFNNEIQ